MSDTKEQSFIANLWERRLPQFFATYVGICWGILQFLNFACSRYDNLPDGLVDKYLVFVTLLIPGVLFLIYNHGKRGPDKWTKKEKIFIPTNLVIATIIAMFVGSSSEASAAPIPIEITNEEGEQITRYVPATSQTRQLALFPFDMDGAENEWTKLALPYLMSKDLEQDMRFYARTPGSLNYQINSFDYKIDDKIPFSTKLQIANKTKVDYFLTGENLHKEGENWIVDIKIYESGSGELFQEKKYSNTDFYALIDDCTENISSAMFLKENATNTEKVVDLPASDLITPNLEALAMFFDARKAEYYSKDYQKGVQLFQKASELDSKSAEIKRYLSYSLMSLGDMESAKKAIGESLSLSKQLPERQQLAIKQTYWSLNEKSANILVLMNNWIKLYPQDFEPHKDLINYYRSTLQLKKAKEIALHASENGNKDRVLAELVDLSIQDEDYDEAEKFLKEYLSVYPELAKEDMRMAEIYVKKGEYEKATSFYENLILDDPQNGKIYGKMADTNLANGDQEQAMKNYEQALRLSDQAQDSTDIYFKKMVFYASTGVTSKFNETFDLFISNLRNYNPEPMVAQRAMQLAGVSAMTGSDDHLRKYFDDFYTKMPQMQSSLECYTNFLFNLFKNDAEEFMKYNQGDCKALVFQGAPDMKYMVDGFLNSMEGKHKEALENFEIFIKNSGAGGKEFKYYLAKEYRLLEEPKKAIALCQDYLKTSPNNGIFLFELGLAEFANGDKSSAKETYQRLQKVWSKAEPPFMYYDEYKKLGTELGM